MAKIQLLAIISMDGHLLAKSDDAYHMLHPEDCDIKKIVSDADYILTDTYPISLLVENDTRKKYLFKATPRNIFYGHSLLRLHLVDEIILFTVPFIAGTGCRLFKANLPTSNWNLVEKKEYNGGILRTVYRKKNIQE